MARSAFLVCLPVLAASVVFASACGGGSSGPVPSTTTESPEKAGSGGREPAPGGREGAGNPESPPASQDPAPPSQDPSGSGGGGTTVTGACVRCDVVYLCNGTSSGQPIKDLKLSLTTKNGACVLGDQQTTVIITCTGKVTDNGQPAGTWRGNGDGFSYASNGVTLDCQPAPVAQPGIK